MLKLWKAILGYRWRYRRIYCFFIACFIFLYCCIGNFSKDVMSSLGYQHATPDSKDKVILLWTDWFDTPGWGFGLQHEPFLKCPVKNCFVTEDKGMLAQSDAVFFHMPKISEITPPTKHFHQVWVFFTGEPASYWSTIPTQWKSLFNWTYTYRLSSDLTIPYGNVVSRDQPWTKNMAALSKSKTKLIAWFVSRCKTQSRREDYVKLLQRYIDVDIYGYCGPLQCRKEENDNCLRMLDRDYLFYLSFENSFCIDYITEKFYAFATRDIVPIVRGGADYKNILPKNSFINTADFQSPKELAKYLAYLSKHPNEYAKYFSWKTQLMIDTERKPSAILPELRNLCTACQRLNDVEKYRNFYENIDVWWNKDACRNPTDIN